MMRRWLSGLLLLLLPLAVSAEVAIPPLSTRVTDTAGVLQAEQKAALESKLATLEQEKGSQIAILIVPTTQPEAIEQYSIRVAESWKLGRQGVDDGLLILVAPDDRAMRIEVGYGLEGVIPDAIAKRVIAEIMTPFFRQGDFYGGLNAAVDQLAGLIAGEPLPAPANATSKTANNSVIEGMLPLLLFGAIAVGGILRAIFGRFLGGTIGGGLVGAIVWMLGGGLIFAIVLGMIAFFMTMSGGMGGFAGGMGRGGFGSGGGGFSGGGGGFGGGGASGRW